VERALELADVNGLEAVTIRGLAADLGVTPMALYWHVRNKDELLDAMGDQLFEGALPARADTAPWHEQLTLIIDALVERFRRHPGSLSLAYRRVLANADGLAITESALQLLHDAGFSPARAASIAAAALHNAVTLVADRPGGELSAEDAARAEAKRATIAALPADRYPRLLESGAYLIACADDADYYHAAIEMFIAGVRATAPATVPF
jgi:TetR/AcrR family tetracycline transcriptional repressor